MAQKKRQCNMTRRKEEKYCAEHLVVLGRSSIEKQGRDRKRVPCPLDPKHSVWEDQVKNHVKKCSAKRQLEKPTSNWFKEDHNLVGCDAQDSLQAFRDRVGDLDYDKWIPMIRKVYEKVKHEPVRRAIESDSALESRLMELENQKHALQQSSLIGHMKKVGALDRNNVIAEFGCGRGELSRYVCRAMSMDTMDPRDSQDDDDHDSKNRKGGAQKHWLIDRAGPRLKLDSKLVKDFEESGASGEHPIVARTKVDIKDLYIDGEVLEQLGFGKHDKVSAVSKHLCGCATDLTLECLNKSSCKVGAIAIALCCRQLCSYETYPLTGRDWLKENGIDSEGFHSIARMSSWAVCGRRPQPTVHKSGLDYDQREEIGLMCRRIIDYGRVISLRKQGYKVELVQYVDSDISLENVCLLAN